MLSLKSKPHILFVHYKWHAANPDYGLSASQHILEGSLESSGLASCDTFYLDEFFLKYHRAGDYELLSLCSKIKPDLIHLGWANDFPHNLKLQTLDILSHKMNIPIVVVWGDLVWDLFIRISETLLPYVRLNIVLDSASFFPKVSRPEKYLLLWGPMDMRIFSKPIKIRDIPVCFMGSEEKTGRKEKIDALTRADIGFYYGGGQFNERSVSIEEYITIYKRSKIVVNFSANPTGFFQVTGRVFEATLAGAMLLEEDNMETSRLLTPMVDYVPYDGVKDLIDKAKYYLEHEDERAVIAENGCRKVIMNYNSTLYWKSIFDRVFGGCWENNYAYFPALTDKLISPVTPDADDKDSEISFKGEDDLSIIILTSNRPKSLINVLRYYGHVGFKGCICIGDSSDNQYAEEVKNAIQALESRPNIIYRHFPKPPYMTEGMIIKELIELSTASYVVFSGDDDFLIPRSLQECVIFLKDHADYSAAHGLQVELYINKNGQTDYASYVRQPLGELEKASERWLNYMGSTDSTQYYVHRKETLQRMYSNLRSVPVPYLGSELLPCGLTFILGKVKQLECLTAVFRADDRRPFRFSRDMTSLFDVSFHPDWSNAVQSFKNIIIDALIQQDNINGNEAYEIFDRACWRNMKSFFGWQYRKLYADSPVGQLRIAFPGENVYTLITYPGWSTSIRSTRDHAIQSMVQNNQYGGDIGKAREMFDRELWHSLLTLLNDQYQKKYGEDYHEQPEDDIRDFVYKKSLSLENLLNPSSPFYKDFKLIYEIMLD